MKKKSIICLFIVLGVFLLTACTSNDNKNGKKVDTINHDCVRTSKTFDRSKKTTLEVQVDKKGKFVLYVVTSDIDFLGVEATYNLAKSDDQKVLDELKKNQSKGYEFSFKADDAKMTIQEVRSYTKDVLNKEEKDFLKKDQTFDIDGWKEYATKKGFTCEKSSK